MRAYVYEACILSSSVHEVAKIKEKIYNNISLHNVTVIYWNMKSKNETELSTIRMKLVTKLHNTFEKI
jgi:hypothetical protein